MGGMSTRNEIKARLGVLAEPKATASRPGAKAKFGIWGDVPSQYRAAVDFIRKQGRPSSAAMNELKKAIKQRLAYAAQARDPSERQMYGDDAGSLENVLEYAQSGDKATLLRATYNMDTAVRDDVPNEMFIWAGGDVNWSHPNVKAMLDRVSRQAGAASPTKRRAMRPGAKAKFADGVDSILTIKGVRYRIADVRTDAQGNTVYRLHGTSKTAQPVQYTLVKFKEGRWVLWGAQGQEVARGKTESARPSAPAQKPGRKVMSESDPAVSAKIRKLMAEGKPQEQAVAIALDMKRRGEI